MRHLIEPSPEKLKEFLSYDLETGKLYWLSANSNRVTVGKEAGSFRKTTGYLTVGYNNKHYAAHRIIWAIVYNEWPKKFIDHIDGNKINNKIDNLREATQQQNNINKPPRKGFSSSYLGVCKPSGRKWLSQIQKDGVNKFLGYFTDEVLAAKAYDKAAKEWFGEFAHLNFKGFV